MFSGPEAGLVNIVFGTGSWIGKYETRKICGLENIFTSPGGLENMWTGKCVDWKICGLRFGKDLVVLKAKDFPCSARDDDLEGKIIFRISE